MHNTDTVASLTNVNVAVKGKTVFCVTRGSETFCFASREDAEKAVAILSGHEDLVARLLRIDECPMQSNDHIWSLADLRDRELKAEQEWQDEIPWFIV
jgi:hypothetical protein